MLINYELTFSYNIRIKKICEKQESHEEIYS